MRRHVILVVALAACLMACSEPGSVKVTSAKFVNQIAANGVAYQFQDRDIVSLEVSARFVNDPAPQLKANSDERRQRVYEIVAEGSHFRANHQELKPFWGYWPEKATATSAQGMTLIYVVPKDRVKGGLTFTFDGSALGRPAYKYSYAVPDRNFNAKRVVKDYQFNGTKVPLSLDEATGSLFLAVDNAEFRDAVGRDVVILGFKESAKPNVVVAALKLTKGQSTTFTIANCKEGIKGKSLDALPTGNRTSKGRLALAQKPEAIVFTVEDGVVELGVSFEIEKGLRGDLEGNMILDYFTKGTEVHLTTALNL
jgi:hypothetical protein